MANLQGKIVALYEDKERNKIILPKTNISAVSDDEGIYLNEILDTCAYQGEEDMDSTTVSVDADTLDGQLPSYYASKQEVNNTKNEISKVAEATQVFTAIIQPDDWVPSTNNLGLYEATVFCAGMKSEYNTEPPFTLLDGEISADNDEMLHTISILNNGIGTTREKEINYVVDEKPTAGIKIYLRRI